MNTNLILVPDLHSRPFHKSILSNTTDKIIFLGDYGDPYPHEGFTFNDTVDTLMQTFSFAENNKDRVILLIGNHKILNFS